MSPSSSLVTSSESARNLLVIIPNDAIDVEEEIRRYAEFSDEGRDVNSQAPPISPTIDAPPSVFSNDIWLGDNQGGSAAFAQNVEISGWTTIGDKSGGAYVVYDCVIRTKEGTVIHVHKRYSDFEGLYHALRRTLHPHQQHFVPPLPPKSPFARYRTSFLDRRRRLLHYWLSSVLLHPEIGGCKAVRMWVMD